MSEVSETVVWRDGDRLVSRDCGGYNDMVEDENLRTYAADESLHELDRAFAAVALAVREYERAVTRWYA